MTNYKASVSNGMMKFLLYQVKINISKGFPVEKKLVMKFYDFPN